MELSFDGIELDVVFVKQISLIWSLRGFLSSLEYLGILSGSNPLDASTQTSVISLCDKRVMSFCSKIKLFFPKWMF